jgi:hypothetical protein
VKLPPLRSALKIRAGNYFAEPGREVRLDPEDRYIVYPRSSIVLLA